MVAESQSLAVSGTLTRGALFYSWKEEKYDTKFNLDLQWNVQIEKLEVDLVGERAVWGTGGRQRTNLLSYLRRDVANLMVVARSKLQTWKKC